MSGDDEVAVVYYKGKWYVSIVHGGNAWVAIIYGQCYENYDEALRVAYSYNYTEYGVCVYNQKDYDPSEKSYFQTELALAKSMGRITNII
jgi:hypothetical protein